MRYVCNGVEEALGFQGLNRLSTLDQKGLTFSNYSRMIEARKGSRLKAEQLRGFQDSETATSPLQDIMHSSYFGWLKKTWAGSMCLVALLGYGTKLQQHGKNEDTK